MPYTVEELAFARTVRDLAGEKRQHDFDKAFPRGQSVSSEQSAAWYEAHPFPPYVKEVIDQLKKTADLVRNELDSTH